MSDYKEIKVQSEKPVEEDVIEITIEEAVPDVDLTEEIEKEVVKEEKVEQEPKKNTLKKSKSRSKKRIMELNARAKEAEERAKTLEERLKDLEKSYTEDKKTSKTTIKTTLEDKVKSLTARMKDAMESGDSETVIELQDDLINTKMELAGVLHELKVSESVKVEEKTEQKQTQTAPEIPEKALDWIEEHPSFKTDELFRVAAITVNNQLLREGYDVEDEEFYIELDTRLQKRFPEEFGMLEENSVESKKISSDDDTKDVKEKSSQKARVTEQTVSGSSRPSSTSISTPAKKNSVTLTPEDIQQADSWGLSLEQMARRIAHLDKNRKQGGYAPIQIPNKN